jgi:MarR family transcriptional regulator, lower aerobic nicotinate degradation pathway regulator
MSKEGAPKSSDVPAELAGRPGFLLRKAHQVAVAIFAEEAGHLFLTPPQHNVLAAINQFPGCSQSDISRAVGYDRATIGAVVAGLEARELIERKASPLDRRLKALKLTEQGRKLLKATEPITRRINKRVVETLSPEERKLFVDLLSKVAFSRQEEV